MKLQILQIIIEILIFLLGLYIAFVKSYIQEKGKNYATKEDIGEITKNIESVKIEFQVLTHSRTTLNQEKRNSFLNYYDKYFDWLNLLLDKFFNSIDSYNSEEIAKFQVKLNSLYIDLCNAETRMTLWNDDINFNILAEKIKIETYNNLHRGLNLHLIELKKINLAIKEFENTSIENRPSIDPIFNQLEKLNVEYSKKVDAYYSNLYDIIQEFTNESRSYLISMI